MRPVFSAVFAAIFSLVSLMAAGAPANAAKVQRPRQQAVAPPDQAVVRNQSSATPGYAVPGWSDEATRQWMGQYDSCKSIHCPG